jgi:hypothetical protein
MIFKYSVWKIFKGATRVACVKMIILLGYILLFEKKYLGESQGVPPT